MSALVQSETSRDILAFDPLRHPDFVPCLDPRLESGHARPTVYVPSLVYLLHILGGPGNVSEDFTEPTEMRAGTTGAVIVEAVRPKIDDDGGFQLFIDNWHKSYEHSLAVVFNVPAKWHLGEWEVSVVMAEDIFSATTDLDRDIALLCDKTIGQALADDGVS